MNITLLRLLFFVTAALTVVGAFYCRNNSWGGGAAFFTLIIAIFCVKFGQMLVVETSLKQANIKLGSETLPPIKDVAKVLVRGTPISEERTQTLLRALAKAKRASTTGSIVTQIPFQIVDHWGGTWDLSAYQEKGGPRGFSINRVYYAGTQAARVAECVGFPPRLS